MIAGVILLLQFALGLNLFSLSPMLPLVIDDFGISRTTAGLLVAGPVLMQAFFGLPGSLLHRRFGLRRTVLVGAVLVGSLAISFAVTSFTVILILRLVSGAGAGLLITGTGPLIMQWFHGRELPVMNTLFLTALSGGISVGVLTGSPLAGAVEWRVAVSIFGATSLLGALAWLVLGRTGESAAEGLSGFQLADLRVVLGDRTVASLVTADALVFIQYAVLTSWLPTFFNESRGMSLDQAGFITGLLPAVGIVAVLVGGVLSYRFPRWRLMLMISGVLVGVSGLASYLLTDTFAISVAVIVLGVGTWIYQPVFHTIPMQLSWMTPDKVALVWGSSMTIAGIGMFVAPIVVGASRDLFGSFVPGFLIWSILAWALVWVGFTLSDQPS
ncbi:MAG: CynX/NimT family MFS transporter [Acidimicrobiales bacterium]